MTCAGVPKLWKVQNEQHCFLGRAALDNYPAYLGIDDPLPRLVK